MEVSNQERYSINCMFFRREFWNQININHVDDEHQTLLYCKKYNKKIFSDLEVPMIHLFFYTQREENKDLIPKIRSFYQQWLNIPFPISMCPLKEYENENRMRWIEQRLNEVNLNLSHYFLKNSLYFVYKKYKYKLLSKITFGGKRKKYKRKYKELKRK